jgi:hypothetical protein
MAKRKLPTQRTMEVLRKEGLLCGVVERWNSHARVRQDLFGFIDVIAIRPYGVKQRSRFCPWSGIIAVQCCARSSMSEHRKKILNEPRALTWLKSGGTIEMWGWDFHYPKRKDGSKSKAKRYRHIVEHINADQFWLADGDPE